jgi:hypothetical protein
MLAQPDGWMVRGVEQQCLVRTANEAAEQANLSRPSGAERTLLRCECGDPGCATLVAPTHAEYESVRARGSQFIITLDHENPETVWVLSEGERFAVVDVVARDARRAVMLRNPRHTWVAVSEVEERRRGGSR